MTENKNPTSNPGPGMNSEVSMDAWIDSKENVQPLREGRDATLLASATTPDVSRGDKLKMLEDKRMSYEQRLVAERSKGSSSDVLRVWNHYIKWARQSYPTDSVTVVVDIMYRCMQELIDCPEVADDPKYVSIWIKYADIRGGDEVTREVFECLKSHNIGLHTALYYEALSAWHENSGRFADAKKAFNDGFDANAQPRDRLQRHYKEFLKRCGRNLLKRTAAARQTPTSAGKQPVESSSVDVSSGRSALGVLSTESASAKVGSERAPARNADGSLVRTGVNQIRSFQGIDAMKRAGNASQTVQVLSENCNPDEPIMSLSAKRARNDLTVDSENASAFLATPAHTRDYKKENVIQPTEWSSAGFGPKTPSSVMKRGYSGLGIESRTPVTRDFKSPWSTNKKSANTSISIFIDKEFDERRNVEGEPIKYYRELLNDNGEELQFEESRLKFALKAAAIVERVNKQASQDGNSSQPQSVSQQESCVPTQPSGSENSAPTPGEAVQTQVVSAASEPASRTGYSQSDESDKENSSDCIPSQNLPAEFDCLKEEDKVSESVSVEPTIPLSAIGKMKVFEYLRGSGPIVQDFGAPSSSAGVDQSIVVSETKSKSFADSCVSEPASSAAAPSVAPEANPDGCISEPASSAAAPSVVPQAIPDDVLALSPFSKEFREGVVKARAVGDWCEYIQSRFSGEHMASISEGSVSARISFSRDSEPSDRSISSILSKYSNHGKKVDEVLAVYYAIEILECLNICCTAGVVHGSVTADSFSLRYGKDEEEWPEWEPSSLACEHGSSWTTRGLTLGGFNENTSVDTSFVHPEQCAHRELPSTLSMIPNPEQLLWATDSLSAASVLHQVVFDNASLAVKTDSKGRLCPAKSIRHTWASRNLWVELFDTLLNWRDDSTDPIHNKPPYAELCKKFEEFLSKEQKRLRALKMQLIRQQMM